jgi:hypothetical protein
LIEPNYNLFFDSNFTMKFSAVLLSLVGSATAFAPAAHTASRSALQAVGSFDSPESLPGVLAPVGFFDPLGFCANADAATLKKYREAELQHGRVAMLAALGMLVTEEPIEFHPLFEAGVKDIGPAIRHLDEVRAVSPFFFEVLGLIIGALELNRALVGWESEDFKLKADYYPGDIGFDPLGLKPTSDDELAIMATKELQNGRLAMLGAAGMIAQELVNGKEIFVNLGLATDRFDPSSVPVQF